MMRLMKLIEFTGILTGVIGAVCMALAVGEFMCRYPETRAPAAILGSLGFFLSIFLVKRLDTGGDEDVIGGGRFDQTFESHGWMFLLALGWPPLVGIVLGLLVGWVVHHTV